MTRTIWVTWATFLMDQAGLIRKLNYLDVTQIFNRSHVLKKTAGKRVNLCLVNALKHCWCETSLLSKLFWSMWCPEILFSRSPCMGPVLYPPRMKKSMALFYIRIFPCHFALLYLSMWVISGSYVGHILIALWVSGSTGVTHFQPWCACRFNFYYYSR